MEKYVLFDNDGVIEDFETEEAAIASIPTIRKENIINGDLVVAKIVHVDN